MPSWSLLPCTAEWQQILKNEFHFCTKTYLSSFLSCSDQILFFFFFFPLDQSIIMRRELFQIGSNYPIKNLDLELVRNYSQKKLWAKLQFWFFFFFCCFCWIFYLSVADTCFFGLMKYMFFEPCSAFSMSQS